MYKETPEARERDECGLSEVKILVRCIDILTKKKKEKKLLNTH